MFSTVLRNLFDNAIKFTDSKGKISIEAYEKNKDTEIIVSDTGKGMTTDTLDKLFKLNADVRSKGTNGEVGSGLGLLLCKEFVEMNEGQIHVSSKPGRGTKFTLIFPKKPPSGSEDF